MFWYLMRRVGQCVVVLLGLTVAVFALMRFVPGDPARTILGPHADLAAVQHAREQLGLTGSLASQYWEYMRGLVQLDFGVSIFKNEPVGSLMWPALVTTLELVFYAIVISVVLAVPAGVISAVRRNR